MKKHPRIQTIDTERCPECESLQVRAYERERICEECGVYWQVSRKYLAKQVVARIKRRAMIVNINGTRLVRVKRGPGK